MKFQFFILSDKTIPVTMRLISDDGRQIEYVKCPGLNYIFMYDDSWTAAEALEATKSIASSIELQSEDHGSRWTIELLDQISDELTTGRKRFRVSFRIRDAY